MSERTPAIACTLTASELPVRAAELRALGEEALLGATLADDRAVLRFRGDAHARVEAAVAAEADCCAFLDFALEPVGDELVLTIAAPAGAGAAVAELVGMLGGPR